ncbi:MAG: lytic transglycosylase domain-containing protein [Candidatus Yonathbacteria bacterium]|nr:lytic transglycosylase domain-containing protein [Candidatus Yonathbacteria bacterium]NTW47558.1 lytic transglycosylase domain-containing protein [Candidatus Yonathbacteria bacterium]
MFRNIYTIVIVMTIILWSGGVFAKETGSIPLKSDTPSSSSSSYELLEPSLIGGTETTNASNYFETIYVYAIGAAGVLAVLMFAIGGIQYMFGGANPASKSKGVAHMSNAVWGIILALSAYLILNTINPDLVDLQVTLPEASIDAEYAPPPAGDVGESTSDIPSTVPTALPSGCKNYVATFKSIASSTGVSGCLLYGIASQESGCNPNAQSSSGACGMMQFLPKTAGQSCDWLKTHPEGSISLAAQYLSRSRNALARYTMFNIGSRYTQSNTSVTVGSYIYDAGNDDLIASYNAGYGTKSSNGGKGPFAVSDSCASRNGTIPVWQCDINTAGYAQTRNYVRRVQTYQDQCESSGVLK